MDDLTMSCVYVCETKDDFFCPVAVRCLCGMAVCCGTRPRGGGKIFFWSEDDCEQRTTDPTRTRILTLGRPAELRRPCASVCVRESVFRRAGTLRLRRRSIPPTAVFYAQVELFLGNGGRRRRRTTRECTRMSGGRTVRLVCAAGGRAQEWVRPLESGSEVLKPRSSAGQQCCRVKIEEMGETV